jgi:peptide/nickel transport system permease protein
VTAEIGPKLNERGTIGSLSQIPVFILLAFLVVILVLVCAIGGDAIGPYPPNGQNLSLGISPPGAGHPLGTDDLGRDILSRLIAGARTAVIGPIAVVLGAFAIGNILGLFAGYRRGWSDGFIMRWVDVMYAIPPLLIAIVVVGILGSSYWLGVGMLVILTAPYDTRIVRGATLEQASLPYVEAARTLGLSEWRIMLHHIWPNLLPVVIATSFLNFAFSLVNLAALSFLGLGVSVSTPDWGRMLADGIPLIFDNAAVAVAPAIMIVVTAASMNLIGDWFYEWLSDRGRAH